MNRTLVVTGKPTRVVIGATGIEEITQNVRMIMTTLKGSLFFDRDFGLDASLIDLPQPIAMARLRNTLVEQIERYEPRVEVTSIDYQSDWDEAENGQLTPVVQIKIKEGVLL